MIGDCVLRIAYRKQNDRYGHRIILSAPQEDITLLESVESEPDVNWPESPPLQDFEIEPRGGSQKVALMLGMAGTSHWSASVEVERQFIRFDIACRIREAAESLGSTYAAQDAKITLGDGAALIETPASLPSVELLVDPDGSTRFELRDENQLWIGPEGETDELPATVRWKYSLRLSGN